MHRKADSEFVCEGAQQDRNFLRTRSTESSKVVASVVLSARQLPDMMQHALGMAGGFSAQALVL